MIKLVFFVHCQGWKNGGYQNTHYFKTEKQAREYAKKNGVDIVKLEKVTLSEFAEDYMGGCY